MSPVRQQSMKIPVQARGKSGLLFVDMHKIRRAILPDRVPALPELAPDFGVGKLLSGKDESDILSFVSNGHCIRKRIFYGCPPDIHPQGFIHPRASVIKRLVANGLNHPQHLRLGPFTRHVCNKTDDSWHIEYGSGWEVQTAPGIFLLVGKSVTVTNIYFTGLLRIRIWSRREELNAPSAEYDSAALTLSYTGLLIAWLV